LDFIKKFRIFVKQFNNNLKQLKMKNLLALAFVATMVVLSACGSSKSEGAADSVTVDSTVAAQADSIATDSVAADSAVAK
jgi:ApbE superfamily uncharacterized protein (UPF0280 family)